MRGLKLLCRTEVRAAYHGETGMLLSVRKSKSPEHCFVPAMIPDFSFSTQLTLQPEFPFCKDKKKE